MAQPRTTLEISDAFFNDALDLLRRYKHTAEIFWGIKSRRLKLFVDLRIAYECILKSRFAYDADPQTSREALIKQIEAYGHRIDRLLAATQRSLPSAAVDTAKRFEQAIAKLPVSLRYKLDGFDFLSANEDLYYQTIGSDSWLIELGDLVTKLVEDQDTQLRTHSGIVTLEELKEEIMNPKYNKYRPNVSESGRSTKDDA